jgi:site-specific DNA-cytosine methylase
MDYQCKTSVTLNLLRDAIRQLKTLGVKELNDSDSGSVSISELEQRIDESLSLRLLLEHIGHPTHHLATDQYLSKKGGNHGDWLARIDPNAPCRTIVSHMGKDTYGFVHPSEPRTLSLREAARIQSFPDWFSFENCGFVDGFRMIGNAVPPLLSRQFAERISAIIKTHQPAIATTRPRHTPDSRKGNRKPSRSPQIRSRV